jgi:Ca2+-binding EF-hand superfamily protein
MKYQLNLPEIFNFYDNQNNGYLKKGEFRKFIKNYNKWLVASEVEEIYWWVREG